MRKQAITALLLAALFALPAFPQTKGHARAISSFASDYQTVPVMANTAGANGAVFQTYVALLNPTSSSFPIDVTLYDNAGVQHNATITLAAGEQKSYPNFLDAVFQFTGGGAVTFRSADPAKRFVVNADVRTAGKGYGTSIPALEFAGSSSRSFSPGITVDANSRANIGCFNQSDAANKVKATFYDNSGKQFLGAVDLALPANGWAQAPINAFVAGGYVQFDPQDSAVCYAVVVDNATNDGRFVPAAEYTP